MELWHVWGQGLASILRLDSPCDALTNIFCFSSRRLNCFVVWCLFLSCRCRPNQGADFWRCSVQAMPAQESKCIVSDTQERLIAYIPFTVDIEGSLSRESGSPSIFMVLGMDQECTAAGSFSNQKRLQELASLHQSPVPCFSLALCIAMS